MTSIDLHASVLLLVLLVGIAGAYAVRLAVAGPAHFARVDAAGASPFLGTCIREMAYWSLQPPARAAVWAGLSASGITRASLGLGAAAGVALVLGHLGVAGALATAAALGDALDGLVARATMTASPRGALLDAAVDRYGEFFFLGGLALHYHADRLELGLTLLALAGSFMVSYGSAKAEALGVPAPGGAMRRAERAAYLCGGALLSPLAWALADAAGLAPGLVAWAAEAPVLAAVTLVGVVSNISAVRRLEAVARAISAPEPAPRVSHVSSRDDVAVIAGAARQSGAPRPAAGLLPR